MPIDLIDTIKPKNNGTFPMVEAEDVVVGKGTANEKRLPEALAEAGKVAAVDTVLSTTSTNPVQNKVVRAALPQAINDGAQISIPLVGSYGGMSATIAHGNDSVSLAVNAPNAWEAELATKAYVEGLVGDIQAALAAI